MRQSIAVLACLLAVLGSATGQPVYSKDVAPILQAKCQICHRPGDIAPFALMTYDDASTWSADIQNAVASKVMPPWKPVPGHGDFKGAFGLTDAERQTIIDWVAAGSPQGDPADLPADQVQQGDWQLGTPDMVLQMPQSFDVPLKQDVYRCFVIDPGLDSNKWVSAVQVLPGNKPIVHHVLLFLDSSGAAQQMDGQDGSPGYDCYGGPGFPLVSGNSASAILDFNLGLGGWVPGARVQPLPDGVAILLEKKAKLVMQVHYFPNGHPGPDQTQVGLYFSSTPVSKRLRYLPLVNTTFQIPPGDPDHVVTASQTVPFFFDAHAYQIAPHMHVLGRQIQMELQNPGQDPQDLIYINDWDFNWQGFYSFKDPIALPSRSTIKLTCHFDNSANNPKNPNDPLKVVTWGEGTHDEMCLGFLGVTIDLEQLLPSSSSASRKR